WNSGGGVVHYRYRESIYHITVRQTPAANNKMIGETSLTVDGVEQHDNTIPIVDDRQEHSAEVRIPVEKLDRRN
ncbi:MAG: hypothetical protein U0937_04085, partial [Thermodesulfovibrionia bacterium]|nr:hypothetical protein [Thermodesulfovibrionia bacterium]